MQDVNGDNSSVSSVSDVRGMGSIVPRGLSDMRANKEGCQVRGYRTVLWYAAENLRAGLAVDVSKVEGIG